MRSSLDTFNITSALDNVASLGSPTFASVPGTTCTNPTSWVNRANYLPIRDIYIYNYIIYIYILYIPSQCWHVGHIYRALSIRFLFSSCQVNVHSPRFHLSRKSFLQGCNGCCNLRAAIERLVGYDVQLLKTGWDDTTIVSEGHSPATSLESQPWRWLFPQGADFFGGSMPHTATNWLQLCGDDPFMGKSTHPGPGQISHCVICSTRWCLIVG